MTTSSNTLQQQTCTPCERGAKPLKGHELQTYATQLPQGWTIVEEHHLEKEFTFPDFAQALDFVNMVGAIAEAQNHHPDVMLTYGKVKVTLWTHKIKGLHANDFIMAAKIDSQAHT